MTWKGCGWVSRIARRMEPSTVEVWFAEPVTFDAAAQDRFARMLSDDERARAGAFVFPDDRRAFVAAHAMLREALSAHGGARPAAWRFRAGPFGKPELVGEQASAAPAFNLTHARRLVACAIGRTPLLGIDVEAVDRPIDDATARMVLTPRELATAPDAVRFYDYWTCKEAVSKALGLGVNLPFAQLEIAFDPPRVVTAPDGVPDAQRLSLALVVPEPSHRLAVAASCAAPLRIALRRFGAGGITLHREP